MARENWLEARKALYTDLEKLKIACISDAGTRPKCEVSQDEYPTLKNPSPTMSFETCSSDFVWKSYP